MKKRYWVNTGFYINAESDDKAIELIESICNEMRRKEDNCASLVELFEIPFGKITGRKVKITKNNIS